MILQRFLERRDGIYGHLLNDDGSVFCVTLEHAFPYGNVRGYTPKVPVGTYLCVRGTHQLHHMAEPFQTFEITGVEGHSGIVFHAGNYNTDSDGCVLLGDEVSESSGLWMVTNSRHTFERFMAAHEGQDEFPLTVQNAAVS